MSALFQNYPFVPLVQFLNVFGVWSTTLLNYKILRYDKEKKEKLNNVMLNMPQAKNQGSKEPEYKQLKFERTGNLWQTHALWFIFLSSINWIEWLEWFTWELANKNRTNMSLTESVLKKWLN